MTRLTETLGFCARVCFCFEGYHIGFCDEAWCWHVLMLNMYVYIYIYVCIYIYILYVHTYVSLYIYIYTCM